MIGWHLDFYRELSAICIALQVGPDFGAHGDWNDYLHRYLDWTHAAANSDSIENVYANPEVVEAVYIWDTGNSAVPRLLRLNANRSRIENAKIPENLHGLLNRLAAKSSGLPVALRAWEFTGSLGEHRPQDSELQPPSALPSSYKTTGWQFDGNIPAIVHPIRHSDEHSRRPIALSATVRGPVDWIVIVLDRNYIQRKILPELTKRYFANRGGLEYLEYKVALVGNGKPPQVLFSTDPGFPTTDQANFDSKMNVFGPPPEGLASRLWQSVKNRESLPREEWRSFSAPVRFPVIQYAAQQVPWVLLLQHRPGPLAAVATGIWHRELWIGSVVLLLLTFDIGLIIIASHRAQRLAKLQLLFVASISHELLTPLSAIYGTGRNAMDGLVRTKADVITHGSIIARQASRLIDLVKQSLLFAATESRTNRYSLRPLQVSEIVQCAGQNLEILIREKGINIEEDVSPGLPNVVGDLSALTHCLQNLVVNAIKYSSRNGEIRISASLHGIGNGAKEIRIRVQDHGPGISKSDLRHIFEPFYRSPAVIEAQIHGTGLGLTVAERIAKAMGGKLSVESEPGVGSTFTLHFPIREVDFESAPG